MEQKRKLLWEFGIISIFLLFFWFFVQTNVSTELGSVYIGLTVGAAIIGLIDYQFGRKEIQILNPSNSWITSIGIGVIGYFVIIIVGQLVVKLLSGVPLTDVLSLLQSTAPAFSGSKIINFLSFGIFVAYIESYAFFVVGFDLIASMFNVSINNGLKQFKLWIIMFGIAFLFLLLHVTSKGISNPQALILVFFMAMVSTIMVVITKEGRAAIIAHIIANSLSIGLSGWAIG